eukprot:CAMPEP_0177167548 /NCGR_PEP_ID=MMETSP0367-20130122/8605_1 /TAXON_ID=447022 ORGANISM="Scrippsiella hangoei-like, Strain SHHI-4" /NCGR_SAMPLE_ID=MMETSP0367 /ASSEMBLY_ACC=CAM_ASM_000362 /LENGTH=231 /DNA_ID=CAMNT_0018613649 /DNA_START=1 /DNA_END=697 /DNA_ORIENTATION=-
MSAAVQQVSMPIMEQRRRSASDGQAWSAAAWGGSDLDCLEVLRRTGGAPSPSVASMIGGFFPETPSNSRHFRSGSSGSVCESLGLFASTSARGVAGGSLCSPVCTPTAAGRAAALSMHLQEFLPNTQENEAENDETPEKVDLMRAPLNNITNLLKKGGFGTSPIKEEKEEVVVKAKVETTSTAGAMQASLETEVDKVGREGCTYSREELFRFAMVAACKDSCDGIKTRAMQ